MVFFKKFFLFNAVVLTLFILDRLLKFWFLKNPDFSQDFIINFLNFRLEKNFGLAFGLKLNKYLLIGLSVIIIFILFYFVLRAFWQKDIFLTFNLSLIIVGAISNLIDRSRFGFVIDYIDVPGFTIFNLADAMITCGVGLLIIKNLKTRTNQPIN